MTETRPGSAPQEQAIDAYDARFALARDRLVRICAGFVGADAAEDVVHDAFLRGRARRHQLRDAHLFEAWITRLAINLCLDRRRSRGRLLGLLPRLWQPPAPQDRGDLGLRELVERLPPRERTLVVLHYGHGYRLDEIARMTGLSAVNVRTIVFRARRRLRDQVEDADR
ncbi:MAG: RNA polymerase sigma factor [Candidatus Limnocylindria bacterium]